MSEDVDASRRHLLTTTLPLGTLACLGCQSAAAGALASGSGSTSSQATGMTAEETYTFFYGTFIPVMQSLQKEMGSERFLAAVTKAAGENANAMVATVAKDLPARDMKAFFAFLQGLLATPPQNKALTYEVTEQSDTVVEVRFSECLPARLLRATNAADIGYALECSTSAPAARAFNPRITVSNPKNLMKGDAYCVERFVLQA